MKFFKSTPKQYKEVKRVGPWKGKKQTPEHVAKRTARMVAYKAKMREERARAAEGMTGGGLLV